MLKVENISYRYNKKLKPVIENMSFELHENEIIGITGGSGAGKSTAVHCILGLLKPEKGRVLFKDVPVQILKREKKLHTCIQLVMQNPENSFNPNKTLSYSLNEIRHFMPVRPEKKLFEKKIIENMNDLQLDSSLLNRYPEEVSGGQLQRFSILRALLLEPAIIIFDESTSMLDTSVQAKIIRLLLDIKEKNNLAYIFISHDLEMLSLIADKFVYL
ncbi:MULTISPECIES: ABC transporter ATP-binding protein [unclassified Treponema]|uniref:ABC transporter ATP-binding protein n=1 Tax=unclassified Treponema TaxID=2638727 RepID=UPI0020A2DB29|nr:MULTISPECIES: dipeptide/oligopeptide/nickel ABC transporter ATP-binding protein [unclassified Treponema]UTC65929.1 ABC transporter ATP-binding protein [Treponema sp. OMZ 789]UTC68657.1 ABC transporter ATP-binding protein [Treponema sp. OMZ 790]UTC71387.1 ABC transporter ATP-binding protein [Treponema sp. OMZ 791]